MLIHNCLDYYDLEIFFHEEDFLSDNRFHNVLYYLKRSLFKTHQFLKEH